MFKNIIFWISTLLIDYPYDWPLLNIPKDIKVKAAVSICVKVK